jgi:hypothetical protein
MGATRVIAAGDAGAVVAVNVDGGNFSMNPPKEGEVPFFVRVWVNDNRAFDSRLPEKERVKPVRIRTGVNTVVVEWMSNANTETTVGNVQVQFNDAKTGKPVPDLFFDMDKR